MFLSGVLFVLFLAGCWVYCLTDAVLTPAAEFPWFRKAVWITVIAVTFIVGAIAWVIARKMWRAGYWPLRSAAHPAHRGHRGHRRHRAHPALPGSYRAADALLAAEALARHPATRSKNTPERAVPIGPDDDHEFLRELAERIRGEQ
ncbi:MAG TPA: hypothetical protein VHT26_08560 [Trebonia sp.]|nr:hypothetical protein [Trebonia sp.]